VLAGTDNDYSVTVTVTVTQEAGSGKPDVYSKPLPAGGVSRIRCDIGTFTSFLSLQHLSRPDTPTAFDCVTLSQ